MQQSWPDNQSWLLKTTHKPPKNVCHTHKNFLLTRWIFSFPFPFPFFFLLRQIVLMGGGFPARSQTFPQAKDKRGEQVAKELASICSNLL